MRLFIPAFLLLSGALGVWTIYASRRAIGLAWLVAVAVSLASWVFGIVSLSFDMSTISIPWLPGITSALVEIQFAAGRQIWFYYTLALTILLSVLLSAPTRLTLKSGPLSWSLHLISTSVLLLAIVSKNLVAWVLTWTLMDATYFLTTQVFLSQRTRLREDITHLFVRLATTFLLIGVILVHPNPQTSPTAALLSQGSQMVLLLAVGLRIGLLPLNITLQDETTLRRGVWAILSVSSPLAGLAVLVHLGSTLKLPAPNALGPQIFLLLWGVVNALLWLSAPNALEGHPYWKASFSALILTCALGGDFTSIPSWSMVFILLGSLSILFTLNAPQTRLITLFAFLTFSALPFTPPSPGWQGLSPHLVGPLAWLWPLVLALLFMGFFRHSYRPAQPSAISERWISVTYILALLLLPFTAWLLWVIRPPTFTPNIVPQALICLTVTVLGGGLILRHSILTPATEEATGPSLTLTRVIRQRFAQFFSFDWLFQWVQKMGELLFPLFLLVDEIFEGQSGLLWALVFLFLLLSLITVGQVSR